MRAAARYTEPGCNSAVRTRSAVFRAPSFRIASARWLSKVLGLMRIRKAPCLFAYPSLMRLRTSRSRLVTGFCPATDANLPPDLRELALPQIYLASLAAHLPYPRAV